VTTISGSARGFAGDGGPAALAQLALADFQNECDPNRFEQISHLAFDAVGNLYVADTANHRVRRVSTTGVITTFAGTGERPPVNPQTCVPTAVFGEGGPATAARLFFPSGLAVAQDGAVILADQQNNRIRRVAPDGVIQSIAGYGLHAFYAPNVPATASGLDWPSAVAVDSAGIVHFAEVHSGRVARIGADGRLGTVAGTGIPGFNGDSGAATAMRLQNPTGIAFDAAGNLYIADQGNDRVRRVTPTGALTTIAGPGQGMSRPADVKVDGAGNVFVTDMNNHRVLRINPAGAITSIAGDGTPGRGPDGVAAESSRFTLPSGLALHANGDVYVVDWGNYLVRRVSVRGTPESPPAASSTRPVFSPGRSRRARCSRFSA